MHCDSHTVRNTVQGEICPMTIVKKSVLLYGLLIVCVTVPVNGREDGDKPGQAHLYQDLIYNQSVFQTESEGRLGRY